MLDMTDRTLQMELADFKDNLFKALSKMADTSDPTTYDNAIAIIADIEAAIRHEYPLVEYFNFLSSGAYKECYELPWPFDGWVMKLASRANNTIGEKALIEVAESRGLHIFPETFFISTPVLMQMGPIREGLDCSDYCTYVQSRTDSRGYHISGTWHSLSPNSCYSIAGEYIIFQQKCTPMSHITRYEDQPNLSPDNYLRKDNFEWDAEAIYHSRIESMTWLQRYLDVHSAQSLNDLFRFIEDYELSDLRRDNIGFTTGLRRPVIMDCLSRA
jgi:hypothetical protein